MTTMRLGGYYIKEEVSCVRCGKRYVPLEAVVPLDTPPLLINNWCSTECYEDFFRREVHDDTHKDSKGN